MSCVAITGPRRAKVTALNEGYVHIDIPGIRWGCQSGKHVHVFNFPRSIRSNLGRTILFFLLQTALLQPSHTRVDSDYNNQTSTKPPYNHFDVEKTNEEKSDANDVVRNARSDIGLTLDVRESIGATKNLATVDNLLRLVDGPYPNSFIRKVLQCNRLLLICGDIGITVLLRFVNNHWNIKLAWSVKDSTLCLIEDLDVTLSAVAQKQVRVGIRLNVEQLLQEEVEAGSERVGVVVCGPGGLRHDIRATVAAASKLRQTDFELQVETCLF